MDVVDFSSSYWFFSIRFKNAAEQRRHRYENSARIQLDARCAIRDERRGTSEEFFLITPCRSEWMYLDEGLLQEPNYEFCAIVSRGAYRETRRYLTEHDDRRQVHDPAERFVEYRIDARALPGARRLESNADVVAATLANRPLVARTELRDAERGLSATLEYPIKTMNVNAERVLWQVDTGPLLVPDFGAAGQMIQWLDVAFIVYNRLDRAELLIRQPTPVLVGGQEAGRVLEYSGVRALPARSEIWSA